MRIALTGNPNSGKTTMYNLITGRNEKVGNWAGVTVDKIEYPIKKNYYDGPEELIAVDLPGAYSMSPFTNEESITSSYVKNERPDVIINIVDATNLSRSLFFTTQLLELEIPVVVALNKIDLSNKKGTEIDIKQLSEKLMCPIVETVSTVGNGLKEIIEKAIEVKNHKQSAPFKQEKNDKLDKKLVEAFDRKRFEFVNGIIKEVEKRKVYTSQRNFGDKIDLILTNKWLGIPIFMVVMYFVFEISQSWLGLYLADTLVGWLESFQDLVAESFAGSSEILNAILVDGIIGGVIAVIGFLPLVMVLYFLMSLLEDSGYMSRVSALLDPMFKKVGLSGKSVIPFVIGTGCGIPAIMSCRTIRNENERRATAMLTTFMPCGAKLPVIALFTGAFFEEASWVGTLMYFVAILLIFIGALIVNRIAGYRPRKTFFIIELPEYKIPSIKRALITMFSRAWSFIVKATTIILLCNTVVQVMQTFDWSFAAAETADSSILASIAGPFGYLLLPIVGVASWQLAAAAVTGFIAKENVVGTLAVCFVGLENLIDVEEKVLMEGAGQEVAAVFAITKVAALAYLMFNLYTPPCFAAIGAMNSEIKNKKWLLGGILFQLATGYVVAYLVYTIGTLIVSPSSLNITFALYGLAFVVLVFAIIFVLIKKADKRVKEEYSLK